MIRGRDDRIPSRIQYTFPCILHRLCLEEPHRCTETGADQGGLLRQQAVAPTRCMPDSADNANRIGRAWFMVAMRGHGTHAAEGCGLCEGPCRHSAIRKGASTGTQRGCDRGCCPGTVTSDTVIGCVVLVAAIVLGVVLYRKRMYR